MPVTVWLLIAGFLLQPVLAYLVTPVLMHDTEGQQIVVCTLKGQKLVSSKLPLLDEGNDTEHCSALTLYQAAGTVAISVPAVIAGTVLFSVSLLDQSADSAHHSLYFSAYSTRAPPLV